MTAHVDAGGHRRAADGTSGDRRCEVVCVGEAMAVLTPTHGGPVRTSDRFSRSVGGAELNVALTLARLGVRTAWLSRVGADGLGDHVLDVARGYGVHVDEVERDPERPTGLYLKETADPASPDGAHATGQGPTREPQQGTASRMHYYRSGSAASAMSRAWLARPAADQLVASSRVVHTSGITAALSDSSADAAAALVERVAASPRTRLTVDLNFRPALWRGRSTAPLEALLAGADEVLLGADEALAVLGTADPLTLGALLPGAGRVLVKEADHGVRVVEDGQVTAHVPALDVHVVEPVGAGDAFAAGYLAATSRGVGLVPAVRTGHLCAALTLGVHQDQPAHLPTWQQLTGLTAVDDATWAGATLPDQWGTARSAAAGTPPPRERAGR